ncbi:MAG: VWA domain-containing protein, partial [Clostridia bacterium]|nr:VWA domain-containing protein [Clostridia bacterium]
MKKRLMASILTVVMILTMLPVSALADGADTEPVEGVVTAHKDLVRDESGAPIVDEDGNYIVELSVQGNPYQIATQSAADVVLVIDNSGSMEEGAATETCGSTSFSWKRYWGWSRRWVCDECGAEYGYSYFDKPKVCTAQIQTEPRIETAKAVAKEFAQNILSGNSGNRLAVIGFAHKEGGLYVKPAVRVSQDLTGDLTLVESAINKMKADGGTDYTSALKKAQAWLGAREDKTRTAYVIFISDGAPGLSGDSPKDPNWNGSVQAAALKTAGVNLYTIGISLSDAEGAYLKKMATDANHYINVNGANYKTQLKNILKLWAEEINAVSAGTKAVLTDVVNLGSFELVSYDDTLVLAEDGKTLTWNIGNIPSEEAAVQFKVKPLEGVYGENIPTNDDVFLDYQDGKT